MTDLYDSERRIQVAEETRQGLIDLLVAWAPDHSDDPGNRRLVAEGGRLRAALVHELSLVARPADGDELLDVLVFADEVLTSMRGDLGTADDRSTS